MKKPLLALAAIALLAAPFALARNSNANTPEALCTKSNPVSRTATGACIG
jgi:uncharacterized lipoprotein YajG